MSDESARWLSITSPQKSEGVTVWAGDHFALDDVVDGFEAAIDWMQARMDSSLVLQNHNRPDASEEERQAAYDAQDAADTKLYKLLYDMIYQDKTRPLPSG